MDRSLERKRAVWRPPFPLSRSARQKAPPERSCAWQARYYREKLGADTDGPAGRRAVVEAYLQVRAVPACSGATPTCTATSCLLQAHALCLLRMLHNSAAVQSEGKVLVHGSI